MFTPKKGLYESTCLNQWKNKETKLFPLSFPLNYTIIIVVLKVSEEIFYSLEK